MKKLFIIGLLIIIWISCSWADIIPEGHHIVYRSVTVSNCNDYPDYTLVGYITGPMINGYEILVIEQDKIINKGYKFNDIKLYAIQQDVIQQMGGIENIDFDYLTGVTSPAAIINPAYYTIQDANPLISDTIIYTIWGIEDGRLIMYISERRLGFNDGSPETVEYYSYPP